MSLKVEDGVEYSFAVEYDGPPITRDLPRAVPININRIPVAAVVSLHSFADKLFLPIVQPISATDITNQLPKDLKFSSFTGSLNVSPTSVIGFVPRDKGVSVEGSYSKELGLESEAAVSPISVENAFDDSEPRNSLGNADCVLLGEFSSDFECREVDFGVREVNGLGCSSFSHDHSCEFTGLVESSGALGFSDSFEKSTEFSGGLHEEKLSSGSKVTLGLNESNRLDWKSNESVLSLDYPSSRVSLHKFGDDNNESSCDVKRAPAGTVGNLVSNNENTNEFTQSEPELVRTKNKHDVKVKKGVCYRCFKGNRFTQKEICMVCEAKYCITCVLRAMGSMPEGRKCVSCIGFPIYEPNRANLGKCSRLLNRLLNDLEVRQIMKAEKFCEVNQLPPEYICVNGRPLCHDELIVLQRSPNPPKNLKPGNYWYDKVSGLWGKEGKKPSQIITPHLNVGGPIKADASDGNTQVYINGREITNLELRVLKLAGVQCAGSPRFWVNEDGSYQEEGQKNTKGFIWGKAGTKLLCAVLSLPVPSKSSHAYEEQATTVTGRMLPDYFMQRDIQKLLLIGYSGSGTSTILQQAKVLYKDFPFSEDEKEHIKLVIQSNVYCYIGTLLEGRERFEEESSNELRKNQSFEGLPLTVSGDVDNNEKNPFAICPRLKTFSDWLLKIMASGTLEAIFPAASREYAPLIEELCSSAAFQLTYKRRNELETLPSIASYFLERVVEILKPDYQPSDADILYAERVTSSNGLSSVDFSFPESTYDDGAENGDLPDSSLRFELIRLQAKGFVENCKWLQMFEDVRMVIFCVSLNAYDQFEIDRDGNSTNKMLSSKKLFETIVTHPTFHQLDFLLLLNKFDLFETKIEQVPLNQCDWFNDFQPVISRNRPNNANHPTMGQLGFHHVAVKFKRLFSTLTGRKLYVSQVKGVEPSSVDAALKYAKEILNWEDEKPSLGLSGYSFSSTETSSFSG